MKGRARPRSTARLVLPCGPGRTSNTRPGVVTARVPVLDRLPRFFLDKQSDEQTTDCADQPEGGSRDRNHTTFTGARRIAEKNALPPRTSPRQNVQVPIPRHMRHRPKHQTEVPASIGYARQGFVPSAGPRRVRPIATHGRRPLGPAPAHPASIPRTHRRYSLPSRASRGLAHPVSEPRRREAPASRKPCNRLPSPTYPSRFDYLYSAMNRPRLATPVHSRPTVPLTGNHSEEVLGMPHPIRGIGVRVAVLRLCRPKALGCVPVEELRHRGVAARPGHRCVRHHDPVQVADLRRKLCRGLQGRNRGRRGG